MLLELSQADYLPIWHTLATTFAWPLAAIYAAAKVLEYYRKHWGPSVRGGVAGSGFREAGSSLRPRCSRLTANFPSPQQICATAGSQTAPALPKGGVPIPVYRCWAPKSGSE